MANQKALDLMGADSDGSSDDRCIVETGCFEKPSALLKKIKTAADRAVHGIKGE